MKNQWLDFVNKRFEYVVISFWMLVFVFVTVHLIHHGEEKGVDWALNAFSALLGALLGLIQGQRMSKDERFDDRLNKQQNQMSDRADRKLDAEIETKKKE